jgi:hypothetical protein
LTPSRAGSMPPPDPRRRYRRRVSASMLPLHLSGGVVHGHVEELRRHLSSWYKHDPISILHTWLFDIDFVFLNANLRCCRCRSFAEVV